MDWPPEVTRHTPGLLGAIAATLWIKDTWPRRVAYVAVGSIASHYGSPSVAAWLASDPALSGFLVGLFSMACAAKAFEALEALSPKVLIDRILTRLGL